MTASSAYVIEVQDATAGIVVREGRGGYRFFASHARFQALEGQVFGHPTKAEQAARRLLLAKAA